MLVLWQMNFACNWTIELKLWTSTALWSGDFEHPKYKIQIKVSWRQPVQKYYVDNVRSFR